MAAITAYRQIRFVWLLIMFLMSSIMADFNTVKTSCSKPCQLTVDACKQSAQMNHPQLTDNCDLMKANIDDVTAYICLVKIGFCTENEFIQLKNEACGLQESLQTVSQAKTTLYQALNATTNACQNKSLQCIQQSIVATVLKQQEHYCDLVNINNDVTSSQACLTSSGCSSDEFNRIKTAACSSSTVTEGKFASVIMGTTPECKGAIDSCTGGSETFVNIIQRGEYCFFMSNDARIAKTYYTCLLAKCTQAEFDRLKTTACDAGNVYANCLVVLIATLASFL